ncbi:MAG: hypothetical protein JXA67_18710 [Micromonosporaceae bacterium]|nr:hypothetical protein [Micromonosporaceae bacterium]
MAVDTYLALPDHERESITERVAERLGRDWLGPRHGDADSLLTTDAYASHLHAELLRQGMLAAPQEPRPATQAAAQPPVAGIPAQVRTQPPLERPAPQIGIEIGW